MILLSFLQGFSCSILLHHAELVLLITYSTRNKTDIDCLSFGIDIKCLQANNSLIYFNRISCEDIFEMQDDAVTSVTFV